jgi:hypothetical protein
MQNRAELLQKGHNRSKKYFFTSGGKSIIFRRGGDKYSFRIEILIPCRRVSNNLKGAYPSILRHKSVFFLEPAYLILVYLKRRSRKVGLTLSGIVEYLGLALK